MRALFVSAFRRPVTWILRKLLNANLRYGGGVAGIADEAGSVAAVVLRHLGGHVSDLTITGSVAVSEHYKSSPLVAAKEALAGWGIATRGAEIGNAATSADIEALQGPLISTLRDDGRLFTVLEIKGSTAEIFDSKQGYRSMGLEAVMSMWTGVILYLEKAQPISEPNYGAKRAWELLNQVSLPIQSLLLIMSIAAGMAIAASGVEGSLFVPWLFVAILSCVGLGASLILVSSYVGDSNIISRVCKTNENWSCQTVLSSQYARIFGVPYADIGLMYFSSCLAVLIITGSITPLVVIGILFGPLLVAYFFYIQKIKIKSWCAVCLVVHAVMLAQFSVVIASFIFNDQSMKIVGEENFDLMPIFIFVVIATLWSFIRPRLDLRMLVDHLWRDSHHTLMSPPYLQTLLRSQSTGAFEPLACDFCFSSGSHEERKAELGILLSSSCFACGQLLHGILQLIEGRSSIHLQYRIRVLPSDETGLSVTSHLRTIAEREGPLSAMRALDRWINTYEMNDYDAWIDASNVSPDHNLAEFEQLSGEFKKEMELFASWMQEFPGMVTPTLFVDGVPLPQRYLGKEIFLAQYLSNRSHNLKAA